MTDAHSPAATTEAASAPAAPKRRTGLFIGVGVGGLVALAAIVTVVLMVALSVIGSNGLATSAARRALLTASDLAKIDGVEIATGPDAEVHTRTLQAYVKANPTDTSHTVTPAKCADNLEGWMAWSSLDTPSYRGWKSDTIYEATNIVVDSTADFENGLQEARHFATVGAATAFMTAQRGWYRDCAKTTYVDPQDSNNDSAFSFTAIPLNLGIDAVVEGSTDRGKNLPPHLVDVYMRNANIVYVTELVTNTSPERGVDRVSLAILKAAAQKLGSLH